MRKILVVEDEKMISHAVVTYLLRENYQVFTAFDGEEALRLFYKETPDLIILDLMIPKISGEDVCKEIRKNSWIPILMLTAKSLEKDRLLGFDIGADDYLTKPFSLKELMRRVNAVLRRTVANMAAYIEISSYNQKDLIIDYSAMTVKKNNQEIRVTKSEFAILKLLSYHPNQIFTRENIISAIYEDFCGYNRTVDSHIKNLRVKIETDCNNTEYIITVRGIGYRFGGIHD